MKSVLFISAFSFMISTQCFAQGSKASKPAKPVEWTTVQRENMAKMHESMATCLRSTKTMKDCRAEMKTSCMGMGNEGCPMMGKGHHGMMWEE